MYVTCTCSTGTVTYQVCVYVGTGTLTHQACVYVGTCTATYQTCVYVRTGTVTYQTCVYVSTGTVTYLSHTCSCGSTGILAYQVRVYMLIYLDKVPCCTSFPVMSFRGILSAVG